MEELTVEMIDEAIERASMPLRPHEGLVEWIFFDDRGMWLVREQDGKRTAELVAERAPVDA